MTTQQSGWTRCPFCSHLMRFNPGLVKLTETKRVKCQSCGEEFKPRACKKPKGKGRDELWSVAVQ